MNEIEELVQVLAVGAASIEVAKYGQAAFEAETEGGLFQGFAVLELVEHERVRQDAKWGEQRHGRVAWAMILAEEIGEWAEEVTKELAHNEEQLTDAEIGQAGAALTLLKRSGEIARGWLENRVWPDRQEVRGAGVSTGSEEVQGGSR